MPGSEIFKLYDTFGFPVDLVEDWCRERGLVCDMEGFQAELAEQKAKSRPAMKVHDIRLGGDLAALADMRATAFLGYEVTEAQGKVWPCSTPDQKRVKELSGQGLRAPGPHPLLCPERRPGGGHRHPARPRACVAQVTDCTAPAPRRHLHHVTVSGARALREGETVFASVDAERRARIRGPPHRHPPAARGPPGSAGHPREAGRLGGGPRPAAFRLQPFRPPGARAGRPRWSGW